MPEYLSPGVYVEETETGAMPIEGVGTSTAGFLGPTERGPTDPEFVTSFADFERTYGGFGLYKEGEILANTYLAYAVEGFFRNGGNRCFVGRVTADGAPMAKGALSPASARIPEPGTLEVRTEAGGALSGTGATALDFKEVTEGIEARKNVVLSNLGGPSDPETTLEDPMVTPDDSGFSIDLDGGVTVAPGTSTTATVIFTPPSTGNKTATLTIPYKYLDPQGTSVSETVTIDLKGEGVEPKQGELDRGPTDVDFGSVPVRDETTTTVSFTHVGDQSDSPITIQNVTVDPSDQGFTARMPSETSVKPGEELKIEMTFTPQSAGEKTAELVIDSTAKTDPIKVPLKGSGIPLYIPRTQVNFGSSGSEERIRLVNRADKEIRITGVESSAQDDFVIADSFTSKLPLPLTTNQSTTVPVTFVVTGTQPMNADLTVTYTIDGSTNTQKITLSGNKAVMDVTAVGPGSWGGHVAIRVENASQTGDQLFKATIRYWTHDEDAETARQFNANTNNPKVPEPDVEEVYDNLSPNETSDNYYKNRINDVSNLIEVERRAPGRPVSETVWLSVDDTGDELPRRSDYVGVTDPGKRTGLAAFEMVDEITIVCAPDEVTVPGLTSEVVNHCELMKDRIAVLQAKRDAGEIQNLRPPLDSKYAAFYYPWIEVLDSETELPKLVPPGGHVVGVYARSDGERGVHKAPANEVIRGAQKLQFDIIKSEQDILNPRGVNCIRSFTGRGIRVWGARTTSSNPQWKYVNVRRLFLYVEESIDEGTQWVVFEPNDEKLWGRVRQSISNFLTTVWRNGALMGTTQEEAFYVKCDRSTMTQDDIDNGRLIVEIGIAPVKPAEFVIFRITQKTADGETA